MRVGGGHGNVLVQRLTKRGGSSRKHQRTQGESGTLDKAKVDKTTHVIGLTIENCVVGILVDAGVRAVFEDVVVRSCSRGLYVSAWAKAAILAIRRSSFMSSANAVLIIVGG